jgi:hypothetical protein
LILLANIVHALGQRGEAEALIRRAVAVREASFGAEHLLVADAASQCWQLLVINALWKRSRFSIAFLQFAKSTWVE